MQVAGRFWRAIKLPDAHRVLSGAASPEGRFHHDGMPALYLSPLADWARIAVRSYLRDNDPPRIVVPVALSPVTLADLRDPDTLAALGLAGHEASVPWQPERAEGRPATSWLAADAARRAGAAGIVYASRSEPLRWHVVLFRWNAPGAPSVTADGPPEPY